MNRIPAKVMEFANTVNATIEFEVDAKTGAIYVWIVKQSLHSPPRYIVCYELGLSEKRILKAVEEGWMEYTLHEGRKGE